MNSFSNQDLLELLRNFEDNFVERKTYSDSRDWLKTIIAFANSTPIDRAGVLFIGVLNDGSIQENQDLDNVQKSLNKKLTSAYPPVAYSSQIVRDGEKSCLAVIVPGSPNRPHFSGPAYVRIGSETINSSDKQFERLIAERNSKSREILRAKDGKVRVRWEKEPEHGGLLGQDLKFLLWDVEYCDQHTVILSAEGRGFRQSIPLSRVEISREPSGERVFLEIYEQPRAPYNF